MTKFPHKTVTKTHVEEVFWYMYIPYRQHCIRLLGLQIHSNLDGLKDSQLLAAYASYQTIKRLHTDMPYRIIDAQQVKDAMTPYSNRTFYRDFSGYNLSSFSPAFTQAFDLPLEQFLRFGMPQLVFDIDRLFSFFRSNHITDINHQVYLILTIKYALFLMPGDVKDNSKETISEDFTQRLYTTYSEKIKHPSRVSLPSKEILAELYRAINMYPLDPSELAVRSVDYEHMKEMSHLLSDILQQPRVNQREIAAGFMMEGKQGQTVLERNPATFSSVRDVKDQAKTLKDALRVVGQVSPLDVLCQIFLHQKKAKNGVSANTHPNDITLENGLIYSLFTSNFSPVLAQNHHAVVFFPSPFFIRKWAKNPSLKSQKVTFVMEDFASANLLSQHYHEDLGRPKDTLTFAPYTQWTAEVQQTQTVTGDIALVFGLQLDRGIRTGIFETLAKRGRVLTVYELLPRRDIESEISNASAFALQSVAWLPLGINNSAQPKRKTLLKFKSFDTLSGAIDTIESYRFGLNTEFGTQAIALLPQNEHSFTRLPVQTIKAGKWQAEISNRQKSEPLCYAFTPRFEYLVFQIGAR